MLTRALLMASPLLLFAAANAQTVQLRFKPPVGKTVSYVSTMNMSNTVPGMAQPMAMSQTMPMTLRIVSRKGDLTTMQTKMGQVRVSVPAGSPMAGMKAQMEKATSGLTTTTTVDSFGNLKGVDAAGSGGAAAMARGMGAGMSQGAQGVSYPNKPLKVGDTWGATLDLGKMMGAMGGANGGMKAAGKIPIVYKLTGLSGGTATISVSMKGTTTMNAGAMAMKMAMNMVGTMSVDAATGLLKSMKTTTDNAMTMGSGGQTMKQHMVMTMTQK